MDFKMPCYNVMW